MTWSPEMENTLVEMVNQGATQSQILAVINPKFGKSYTRSAIAGKMNRMGLKSKSGLNFGANGLSKPRAARTTPPRKRRLNIPAANFGRGVTLENLRDCQCRYPINSVDTDMRGLRFCGQLADTSAASRQERSYCEAHASIITRRNDRGGSYLKSMDKRPRNLT